jgi:hypothetical protein
MPPSVNSGFFVSKVLAVFQPTRAQCIGRQTSQAIFLNIAAVLSVEMCYKKK